MQTVSVIGSRLHLAYRSLSNERCQGIASVAGGCRYRPWSRGAGYRPCDWRTRTVDARKIALQLLIQNSLLVESQGALFEFGLGSL